MLYMKTNRVYTFYDILSVTLSLRSVSGKISKKNQNNLCSTTIFLSESRAVYDIMWKNVVELERPQTTIYTAHALCVLHK